MSYYIILHSSHSTPIPADGIDNQAFQMGKKLSLLFWVTQIWGYQNHQFVQLHYIASSKFNIHWENLKRKKLDNFSFLDNTYSQRYSVMQYFFCIQENYLCIFIYHCIFKWWGVGCRRGRNLASTRLCTLVDSPSAVPVLWPMLCSWGWDTTQL